VVHRSSQGDHRSQPNPTATGEDSYEIADSKSCAPTMRSIRSIQTSGGILRTHKIGDMAYTYGSKDLRHRLQPNRNEEST
jgi:hypothetical protein